MGGGAFFDKSTAPCVTDGDVLQPPLYLTDNTTFTSHLKDPWTQP